MSECRGSGRFGGFEQVLDTLVNNGEAVQYALARKKELDELSLEQLQSFCPLIKDDIFSFLTTAEMIERRDSYGGTAAKMVANSIAAANKWLVEKLKDFAD